MDRDAVQKQMKALYAKAKAARKEGKRDLARTFRSGGQRLQRALRRTKPVEVKKEEGGEEAAAS